MTRRNVTRSNVRRNNNEPQPPVLITQAEAAEILDVDVRSIFNWRAAGRLTTYRLPGKRAIRLSRDEVYALATPDQVTR